VTAFIAGAPLDAAALREPPRGVGRSPARGPRRPALRARFDAFAIVDAYRATGRAQGRPVRRLRRLAAGAAADPRRARGPEHAPVPCHNDLLTANFIHDGDARPDRGLGVRRDGRPVLRPRQPRRSTTGSPRPTTRRCSPSTSASRAPTGRFAACG
jgi:hypothetical protein